jgi:hypothetical protein
MNNFPGGSPYLTAVFASFLCVGTPSFDCPFSRNDSRIYSIRYVQNLSSHKHHTYSNVDNCTQETARLSEWLLIAEVKYSYIRHELKKREATGCNSKAHVIAFNFRGPHVKSKTTIKLSLCLINSGPRPNNLCGKGGIPPPLVTSALDGGKWLASHPCRFTPGEKPPVRIG